jgi:hypothetical protein
MELPATLRLCQLAKVVKQARHAHSRVLQLQMASAMQDITVLVDRGRQDQIPTTPKKNSLEATAQPVHTAHRECFLKIVLLELIIASQE